MTIAEEAKKVAKYLRTTESHKNGEVWFQPSTYDNESDMPHYRSEDDERIAVSESAINEDGTIVNLGFLRETKDGATGVEVVLSDWSDDDLIDMGIDEVLREMFYFTGESYNYLDYETMLDTME